MQTLGQLHNQLALIIGDPILPITINVIPDGVRFSRVQREVYLQRALDEVLSQFIQQLVPLDAQTRSRIATKLFPTTIQTLQLTSTNINAAAPGTRFGEGTVAAINGANLRVALFITALYDGTTGAETTGLITYTKLPLPIHDAVTTNALINSRSTQYPDPFFKQVSFQVNPPTGQWVSDLYLYDYTNEIPDVADITLTYISYPPLLNTLTNFTDIVMFEDMYMNQVYQRAAMYAKIDSQEEDYQMQPQGQ